MKKKYVFEIRMGSIIDGAYDPNIKFIVKGNSADEFVGNLKKQLKQLGEPNLSSSSESTIRKKIANLQKTIQAESFKHRIKLLAFQGGDLLNESYLEKTIDNPQHEHLKLKAVKYLKENGYPVSGYNVYKIMKEIYNEEKQSDPMANKTYVFHEDPGHGWLEVKIQELNDLGVADKISIYSYMNAGKAYLEEDRDASIFIKAFKEKFGKEPKIENKYSDESEIREFGSFKL